MIWFPLLLLFAFATSASAQDDPGSRTVPPVSPPGFDQVVYKGLVGNALDGVPMDAVDRRDLQRINAVVSNTFFGRSLALVMGLAHPVLLLGGLVWGVWAAANISPMEASTKPTADPDQSDGGLAAQERAVAHLRLSPAVNGAAANGAPEPVHAPSNSAGNSDLAAGSPRHVIKIWLAQRAPAAQRSEPQEWPEPLYSHH